MLISDQMPDLSRYQRPEQKIDALYQYVFMLKQQINHVLSNLDEQNLGTSLQNTLMEMQQAVSDAAQQTGPQSAVNKPPWPVGAVYLTADAAMEPSAFFGGKWQQISPAPMDGVTAWQRKE